MAWPMILRLRYIQRFTDRHGHVRIYLRVPGRKRVPLPPERSAGFLAAYQAAITAHDAPKPSRVPPGSLEALTRLYLAGPDYGQLGTSTQATYRRLLAALNRGHGEKPIRTLDAIGVRRLLAERAATPAAANHTLRCLRALMRHAIEMGWRADDPTIGVRRLKERNQGVVTWSEEEITQFERHWPEGTKPRLALALLLYTGQRRSDVVRMGRQHVRNGAIDVHQVKTGTRLTIPLHPELARLIAAETDRLTFLMADQVPPRPYTANGFYMRFVSWVKQAGLPRGLSPHGLRKAAARRLAEAGCTAHQIAAITGHRTLAEVQRYTQAADQGRLARDAMARIKGGDA